MSDDPLAAFVRRHEAAAILGVHVATLDRQIKRGAIPVRRIGTLVLIPRAFFDDLAVAQ
jgi:excisionase family DNA binding protein